MVRSLCFRHQTLCVAVDVNGARVLVRRCVHGTSVAGACSSTAAPPPVGLTGWEVPVEQQLRDLRRALQRLAAAVMWRDGVQLEPLGNTVLYECEDTTSADVTADAMPAGKARPPGIAKHSATTKPELALFYGEAGLSLSRASGTTSADVSAVAKDAGEARPPGIKMRSASTESEVAESTGGGWAFLVRIKWHNQCRRYSSRNACW